MDRLKSTRLIPVAATLALMGCSGEMPQSPVDDAGPHTVQRPAALDPGQVTIVNDPATLEARVVRSNRALTVVPRGATRAEVAEKGHDERALGVRLTLVAEIAPPQVDGRIVQSNDIEIQGSKAVIAYNFAGDVFAGAVQMIDVSRPSRPELESEVLYSAADVNSVALQGSQVFVGLSADDPALSTPAMVQEFKLHGSRGLERTDDWRKLPSWAVTDLAVHGDDLVAAVGARDGGLVSMRRHDLRIASFASAPDPRGIALGSRGILSVAGGPGRMLEHRLGDLTLAKTTAVPGYSVDGAKGTIEWSSGRCYLGSGDAGLQVRDDAGDMLAQLPNSEFSNRTSDGVVNAFTVSGNLGFVAAGPAGVQVVLLGRYRCDGRESEDTNTLRVLGELDLEEGASCNMVRARNDVLVVAGGAGGVKFIAMDVID
jgi:hypothetical protein